MLLSVSSSAREPKTKLEKSPLICVCVFVLVSGITGLLAFLLIVLEWTRPSLPSPLRPICDRRVLNPFIKEAQDAEAAMVSVNGGRSEREKGLVCVNVTSLSDFL